jgi:hypothetical protein
VKSLMNKIYFCCAVALASPCVLLAQTCTITSPSASQLIQAAAPLQLTATVSSAPTAYSLEYDVDYRRWRKAYNGDQSALVEDFGDGWQGPWVATWYSGLYGDGPHAVTGVLRDIFGNTLATCPAVNFTVRIEGMSNQSMNALPNYVSGTNTSSGTGALGLLTFNGNPSNGYGVYVDGRLMPVNAACGMSGATSQSGGNLVPNFNTACISNGLHLISYGFHPGDLSDPYLPTVTFSGSVAGSAINVPNHYSVQSTQANPDAVTFQTTGTLPSPLVPGTQCYWRASSTSSCTVTAAVSGNTIVLTTSVSTGATAGTPIFLRNFGYTNQSNGLNGCDGYYTAAAGTSGTTISLIISGTCLTSGTITGGIAGNPAQITLNGSVLPGNYDYVNISGLTGNWANLNGTHQLNVVSGSTYSINYNTTGYGSLTGAGAFAASISNTSNLEVIVNPYFANYIDQNDISVSATIGGSALPLSGGSGTHTVTQRIRSPYWTAANSNGNFPLNTDWAAGGGAALVTRQINFSNGSAPMEIEPPYWEYHGWAGKSGDTLCALIKNTNLSLSTVSCSLFTYTLTADGGVTGAISVNSSTGAISYAPAGSWSNPSAQTAWAQATVACGTCGAGGTALQTVNVYIENHGGSSAAAITYPHWTTCGVIATSFTTGSCHSFYPLSLWQANVVPGNTISWLGPSVYLQSRFNSIMGGMTAASSGYALINPTAGTCPSWPDSYMTAFESFASSYGAYIEYDQFDTYFNLQQNTIGLAVILNNTGYNRRSCLAGQIAHMVASGRYWRFFNDDEVDADALGATLEMDPAIGGANWTSAVVSGAAITFQMITPQTLPGNWSQATGNGAWIEIVGATNACLNGWYPITSGYNTTSWVSNNNGSCANGTFEPSGGITETTAKMAVSPVQYGGSGLQNVSPIPSNLSATSQTWNSNLTSITVSSCVAAVNWTGNLIGNGVAIRIWNASSANLNIVAPITSGTNSFTFTYPNTSGEACPANGTYNSSTDNGLIITVDPNWGPNPIGEFYSLVDAVPNHPAKSWTILGSNFSNTAEVYSYEGNPLNTDSSFVYWPGSPFNYLGDDGGVNQWINADTTLNGGNPASGGLATRAYQLKPRSILTGAGVVNGGYSVQTSCRSFTFNPGCDRPAALIWRPESITAEIMGFKTHDYAGMRLYNLMEDTPGGYVKFCCGWITNGTGTGGGLNPYIAPKAWAAIALANALITLRTDTELQPEANKPYYGPYFTTDAHTSATYGNELDIVCGSESPYGSFTLPGNPIPTFTGGSVLKYILTGYSLSVKQLSGNPTTDTDEFCSSPGRTTTYVALPASPAVQPLDNITFAPPMTGGVVTLPFGSSKFLVQVGYYPNGMQDDPVTDCTNTCTIGIDHHNTDAWYRVIYADSNSLPRSIGTPVRIPSQGLY